jgi:hypothetical protein
MDLVGRNDGTDWKPGDPLPVDQDVIDICAARLRAQRYTYQQIGRIMGCSTSTAHSRVQRVYKDAKQEATEMARHIERERLDELWRKAEEIANTVHYVTAHGKVVLHPETGDPVIDDNPVLAARREMRAIAESYRKLEGLDAPQKVEQSGAVRYEILGVDPSELA